MLGVDGRGCRRVPVTCCRRGGIVCEVVEVDHGIPFDNVGQLRCDIFWGSSFEVLGFLVQLEIVCSVLGCTKVQKWEVFGRCGIMLSRMLNGSLSVENHRI